MDATYDPDWRYANMSQTEIEDHVKARSSLLMSQTHFVTDTKGKKLKFRVTDKDIEHLVDDALHYHRNQKKPPLILEIALRDEKVDRWVG
jgi:hypothetical protein